MLKNKLFIKKIRNICIFIMAIAILIGTYTYVRRSRAENVIQIEMEVSDKSETLETQKILIDATETQDRNFLLELPTSVNGNIVSKYYTTDGAEVDMKDANADKTLTLTETEVNDKKMQLQTDYDKKEITTEDGQTITLYNKEIMDVKDTEEDANVENAEGADNEPQTNETTAEEGTQNETTQEPELDDSVIVTGYMPLEAQVDIQEIDLATLPEIVLPSDTQTIQKAYEVSIYQTIRRTFDADGNMTAEEIEMPENRIDNVTTNEAEENTTGNSTETITENIVEGNATENTTTNTVSTENITSENARENENVTSVTEATTPDNTTITTIILKDGTRIEEEKIEYDPSIYNEQLTIKTKNTEENTNAIIYSMQEDNQIQKVETTIQEDYANATFSKNNQTVRYILATEPVLVQNDETSINEQPNNAIQSNDQGISTLATTSGTLKTTSDETQDVSGFLGNTSIERQKIDQVEFVNNIPNTILPPSESNLMRSYDATMNTGNGHSNTTTTWKDLSGKQDGTLNGGTWSSDHLTLDGVDDWVNLGTVNVTNQVTLDATITLKKAISEEQQCILNNYDGNNGGGCALSIGINGPMLQLYIVGVGYVALYAGETTINVGEKTRITGTYDGSKMCIYINGELVAEKAQTGNIGVTTNNTVMAIGANPSENIADRDFANIDVYSVNIYNTAISMESMKAWDVSEEQDGSIMAWYEENANGTYKVYIGSNGTIYANPDSRNLFRYIGYSSSCTATETIINIGLLNVSNVTNMQAMFWYTGYRAMTNLDLGNNFDTSNVENMASMFWNTGVMAMRSLDLGDNFNTSNVTNMSGMFEGAGADAMTSLHLGDKFDTSNVTDMSNMFYQTGYTSMQSLDLGPAFTQIASTNTNMFFNAGRSDVVIIAPEAIYNDITHFKLDTNSSSTLAITRGFIVPKYRTEWQKEGTQIDTTDANNPKINITLRGTTCTEVYESGNEYKSDVTSSLTANDIKIFIDNTEVTDIVTTSLGNATQTDNTTTGAKDVLQVLTLSNFEEATRRTGKSYKEWSGNIRVEVAQGTLIDTTYGNKNMALADDGSTRIDNKIEDTTKVEQNTANAMFIDYIEPEFTYTYSSTDINHDAKTLTVDFSVTDKYFNSSSVLSNTSNITIKMADTNTVPENLTTSLRKVQDINETRNGTNVKIGEAYELVISGFEQASVDNGKYIEYSGPVSIAFPSGIITDKSGNTNDAKTITVGIDEPDGTGDQEIVDFITPEIQKISSSIDVKAKTATVTFQVTDKYIQSSPLATSNIQVLVNGSVNTSIQKQLTNTVLNEQRVENGVTSTVQYGTEYTLTLSGLDTTVNQIKVRIPEGVITDTSGNSNEQTDFIVFNTLKSTSTETNNTSPFLGNTNIQRENIDNVTFMDNIPSTVYDVLTDTYIDSTAWDVSAQGDNSIIAWYEPSANETVKVYIGSNDEMFGNVDSSSLFRSIGQDSSCTATETITNIDLLNTSNVTKMMCMFMNTGVNAMTSLDLGDNFDTSNVTNMYSMFCWTGNYSMTSLDLGDKFDTSNVTDMGQMFQDAGVEMYSLNLGDKFDTSNVTQMEWMFSGLNVTVLDLGDKFNTSNVTNMQEMFSYTGYTNMTSLDLGTNFDTSNVTNMDSMFYQTGHTAMTSLDLGDNFDTSNVTNMSNMFFATGFMKMTSLDLGDKFDTSNATNMNKMFSGTGGTVLQSLDLGPAFTNIAERNQEMFTGPNTPRLVNIYAPEAIYQDNTSFKLNANSTTTIELTYMTITPKYRTEWIKETVQTDTTNANNPKLNITLRGTTNTEVAADEYISDVTSSLTANDIKVFIDDTEITDVVTKTVGTATQTANTRTGAQDVLQTVTLSNFEEATRRTGKSYKEWSGNIRIEVAQGSLSDTTGPADAKGNRTTYGNSNMEVASTDTQTGATTGAGAVTEIGARIDNIIEDETKVEQNTANAMFADFIKPEFTYTYSSTDINYDAKTLTVEFSITDKYFNSVTGLTNADGITVKMLDTNAVPENISKTLTKLDDINETRDGEEVKIGETYRLVISGFEQASIENGKYKEYSGPVSIVFPAGIASDKSGNENVQKNITIGINEPDQTGSAEIVDVVNPIWEARNLNMDKENNRVTVDFYGTDKYYENNTLDVSKIKVIIDGEEITSTTNVTKQLSTATPLTETRDGASVQYGVKYTLTLSNWAEEDSVFEASDRVYREYSGETEIQIEANTLVDESGNANAQTTLDLGKIDIVNPDILKVSSTADDENKTETIVFDVIDKDLEAVQISTTNTSKIHVYVDNEEATGLTKTITNMEDITAMVNGTSKVVGKRYTLVISNFEQPRTAINYNREYSDWSGDVSITIDAGTATDNTGNANEETTIEGDFVDFIKPNVTYQYSETDVDHDGKTFTMVFDITDKFYTSETLALEDLTILIDGEEPSWTEVDKALQEEDISNVVNGESKVIGKRYTLTLSNLEQLQVKEGDNYLDYSGVVTVAIPANKVTDTTGNANDATTITSGISLPGGTGTEEVVDVVDPLVEKISSNVDVANKTATLTFKVTDKYFANSTLTNTNIQVLVNGAVNTTITKQLSSTPLNEQRVVDGTNSTVQYGVQYTLTLTGIDTNVNQIKVRVPEGMITDQSGNGNEEIDLMMYNTLKNARTDVNVTNNGTSEIVEPLAFLGNTNLQRENIDNLTFVDNIPEDVYDVSTNTYKDSNAWDVSAQGDNSIIAWYETNANGTVKVYIGSNDEIFGNVDSSYLFCFIGYSEDCTATETITNIGVLNVSNVTNMTRMFFNTGYTAMTSLDLGDSFDTSSVITMFGMFGYTGYTAMTNFDLGDNFDTSKVTDMRWMFLYTGETAMTSLSLGEKFDTSNVIYMDNMFNHTGYMAMTSFDIGDKFNTSNVTSMHNMFCGIGHRTMTSLDLGENFDTSNVTDMSYMFDSAGYTAMTSLDLGDKFDTSSVTNMNFMFRSTGYTAMTSLDLGDRFDTSNVTDMLGMFRETGYIAMTTLDLGDKFNTSKVTDMTRMFQDTGYTAMITLDLGPAFTNIASTNTNMFQQTGKQGEIVIQAPEAIYQDATHFKLSTDSSTTLGWTNSSGAETTTYGTINPKYHTEWIKEGTATDTTDANNPKLNITLRGTTNTEVAADEYISNVTSSLTANDIKVFIDDTEITDIVTKTIGNATQTANTRTGATDVLQVLILSNFEETTRRTGKDYKEWSGNIRVEIAQGTLSDTTGPADEAGKTIPYGNKNMEVASADTQTGATTGAGAVTEIGARIDNIIQDATKVEQNTSNAMFADFIKPEFTYTYSSTDINYEAKTLTVEFSVTDKYFNSTTGLTNANNITVKMLDTNVVPENITKTLTKVDDIEETRNGSEVKIGERYRLVISGFEQASIAEDGKYKEYSGPVSIVFPAGTISDKSGNESDQKNITIGINEPDQTGNAEIVDVVTPIWEARNLQIDKENDRVTVDLYGTDKYYENNTLDVSKIKVIIDGEEVTSAENVVKQLSVATPLTETRDGSNVQYGVKYTLTLSNWKESDTVFQASEKLYREYSGNTEIQISAGTLVDESGNENIETTLDLGMIDYIAPEIYQISSTKNDAEKTDTIVFEVVDKYFESAQISTTDTSKLTVFVDNEEAIGVTKTITNEEDMTAIVDGSSRVIGKRYTLVISNFEQPRTTIDYDREYSDWSGDVTVEIDAGTIVDESGNSNQ